MKTPQEKLPVTLSKSNLAVMTNMTDIEPQPEKKEAVLLISDCDYGIWDHEEMNEPYSAWLLYQRLQKMSKRAKSIIRKKGCNQCNIVILGGNLYVPCNPGDRIDYLETYTAEVTNVSSVLAADIIYPLLQGAIPCKIVGTEHMYSIDTNKNMVREMSNVANLSINQYVALWGLDQHNIQNSLFAGNFGTFSIFDNEIGIYHGNGYTPQDLQNRNFPFGLDYLLTGWNPQSNLYKINRTQVIANGRMHHGTKRAKKQANFQETPHQTLMIFGEHHGLLSTHYLKVG